MDTAIKSDDLDRPLVQGAAPSRAAPLKRQFGAAVQPARARGTLQRLGSISGELGLQFAEFDAAYLERLRARDRATEAHFVVYFSELIRLKLRSRLASREAIEDARQETFMRVLTLIRAEDGLRQPDRLGAFVNSVCNNVLREQYRSKARRESPMDEQSESTFIDPEPSAYTTLELKDTERLVRQTLGELAERDRGLLRSVMLEDRDKGEICAEFGVTRDHLRVLVHRAKQSFKSYYLKRSGLS